VSVRRLLAEFRRLRIEPPTPGRLVRMVRSALRTAEQNWASRIAGRLNPSATARLLGLIAVSEDGDLDSVNEESASVLALIKASPGNVSLESMMTEIGQLQAVRALDLSCIYRWPIDIYVARGSSVRSAEIGADELPSTSRREECAMSQKNGRTDVFVTGLGASTPLGGDVPSSWAALLAGQSGVVTLEAEWAAGMAVKVAAPAIKDPLSALDRVQARRLDRNQQLALVAAREAWSDAGAPEVDPERLAVVVASGVGGIQTTFSQHELYVERGARSISPHSIPMLMPNGAAATVGLELGAEAGVHAPTSACASSSEAIALALDLIRAGRADIVVCGGSEAAIHPVTIAGFSAMRAMSTRGDPAEAASRPFDRDRDGFVLGEGAGILVLESGEHAAARRCRRYARLIGAGITSDAHHVTQPDPQGRGAARAMRAALVDSDRRAGDVVHINAHATSTPLGDRAEAAAIAAVLGARTSEVAVSATKSTTGHLLGAAGGIEAVATVCALHDGIAPPTRNLDAVDDGMELDVVTRVGRKINAGVALSNSFGFGGHNVVLAFEAA